MNQDKSLKQFEVITKHTLYEGFFNLEKYRLRHTLHVGGWSQELELELFRRGNCVGVLLYDPIADSVVIIEQFRVGAIANPGRAWLQEIVAGAIEPGETAEQVAHREAIEEAGCDVLELKKIGEFYTSPGGASERLTLFCGRVDISSVGGVHGLAEEGEDIRVMAVNAEEALHRVELGEIESAIPIVAIQWLALNKDKLRQEWL